MSVNCLVYVLQSQINTPTIYSYGLLNNDGKKTMIKFTNQKSPKAYLFLLVLSSLVSVQSGAAASSTNNSAIEEIIQKTAITGYDLDINLSVDKVPELYKTRTLNIELKTKHSNIKDVKIELIAPNSISTNIKNIAKVIKTLPKESSYHNSIRFVVNQPGKHQITLKVTGYVNGDRYTDRYEYIYFTTSNNPEENTLTWEENNQQEDVSIVIKTHKTNAYKQDKDGYIEIAMADENLNMITKKVKYDEYYNNQKGQQGMVTVIGTFIMRNRENDGAYPYANSLVQLLNGVSGAHQAWSYTDSEGTFTFPAIVNPGTDGVIIRVYSVRFIVGGLGYGVCNGTVCMDNAAADSTQFGLFYSTISPQITGIVDGTHDIGLIQSPFSLTNSLRAMWIKHDMDDAHAHLVQNSLVRGPFTAQWRLTGTDGNYYSLGGNIHFKSDVANGTNHTVLHELGHNIMYNAGAFPTTPTDCPNPHYVEKISGTQCAWTEGWASAFANMVNDDPTRCFAPSTTNCISYEIDPSFNECFPDWDCGLNAHQVEGHVTGALWDLYDANDDGLDINAYGTNEIYDTMELSAYPAFLSWWSAWLAQGFPAEATNSLYQNAIEFTQSYDIDLYNINHTSNLDPEIGESFAISVNGRNLGDATSVGTPVTLYRSFIPVFNGLEPMVLTYDYGEIAKDEMFTAFYGFSETNAGTLYYRACYADQHGLDEDSSNNCSDVISINISLPDLIFVSGFD